MVSKSSSGLRMKALQGMIDEEAAEALIYVSVEDVIPDPNQPRRQFDEASLEEMAESLRAQGGNIVPIEIRENPAGSPPYIMNDGERRWRAAHRVSGLQLKAVLYRGELTPDEIHDRQFIANFHRDNMSLTDQAAYLLKRKEQLGSVEAVAERVQLSPARVYKLIGVERLEGVAAAARDEGLSRDAETLTGLQALEKRDAPAAASIVKKAREEGGKITRSTVSKAARDARQKKEPTAKGKVNGKPAAAQTLTMRSAEEQPGELAVFVRVEPADVKEAARWAALSDLGDTHLCLASMAESAGHAVVIAGGKAEEFRVTSIRIERVSSRHGA